MAAAAFQTPELALSPDESKAMAAAVAEVSSHYNHAINPKLMAWVNLLMVAGGVYGTRALAIRARLKTQEKAKGPQRVAAAEPKPNGAPRTPSEMFPLGDFSFAVQTGD